MWPVDDIKAAYIRKQLKNLPNPQEIETMADEATKNGVPPWFATIAATAAGLIVAAVQDVANGGSLSDLLTHPKLLAGAVLSAFLIRVAHSLTPPTK